MMGHWLSRLRVAANALGVLLFGALLAVFLIQITARFVFNAPLPWTDELAVILYSWVVLWGCTAIVRWHEHVAFDAWAGQLGARGQRILMGLQCLVLGGLCAWALPACWDYVQFMQREATPVLGWSYRWVFMPFMLMLVTLVIRCAVHLKRTLWPEASP